MSPEKEMSGAWFFCYSIGRYHRSFHLTFPKQMTYRGLFRYLLVGCTLLLAGGWYASVENRASFNGFMPGRHVHCRLYRGAVVIITHEGPYPKYDFQAFQLPAIAMHFQEKHPVGPWGTFLKGKAEGLSIVYHYLVFPLWLPYLLVVGAAFGVLKWQERRTKSREKEVAARVAEGDG